MTNKPQPYDVNRALRELGRADRRLGRAIKKIGPCELDLKAMGNPYETLTEAIIYQQLSGKAAATIHGRVRALFPRRRIRPALVLEMDDASLRGAGLSRSKLAAIRDLSEKTLDRTIPTLARLKKMDDQEIVDRLVQVRGIGQWTVEMLLMFHLGRPDVMPNTDLGIRKGYQILHDLEEMPKPKELLSLTEHWRPWRSVASWYMYRLVDQRNP